MSEAPQLITDPMLAKAMEQAAKIDVTAPATKQDVMDYCRNYFNANIRPIIDQQNQIAQGLNLLMDFLAHRGVTGAGGKRFYLRTDEWNEYILMRRQQAESQKKLQDTAKN
jgi:hypothetical protein